MELGFILKKIIIDSLIYLALISHTKIANLFLLLLEKAYHEYLGIIWFKLKR